MKYRGVTTVLDVGANDGGFASHLRDLGYTGRIVSFEPIKAVFDRLEARAAKDPNWIVINAGLGEEEGEATISVAAADVFSSLLKPTNYSADLWQGIHEARRETVTIRRLDRFLSEHPEYLNACFLKLDVQGLELPVLRGAGDLIGRFSLVQAELALKQLYLGQESWLQVVEWMAERGFEIVMAEGNGVDWRRIQLVEMDIIFAPAVA
jgi:FkbM family methyltransferase